VDFGFEELGMPLFSLVCFSCKEQRIALVLRFTEGYLEKYMSFPALLVIFCVC